MSDRFDFEYEKKMIGYLIHYYRKKRNVSLKVFLKNQKDYYNKHCIECRKCDNPEIICSERTMYRIERGFVARNECVYHRFCENLNRKFLLKRDDLKHLDGLRNELIRNLIHYSHTNLKRLADIFEIELEKHRDEIYIEERLKLYQDIVKNKLDSINSDDKRIDLYLYMMDKVNQDDKKLILMNLFDRSYHLPKFDRAKIIHECKKYIDDPLLFKIRLKISLLDNKLYYYENLKEIENKEFNQLTESQKFLLYEHMTLAQLNLEAYRMAYQTILKCLDILHSGADLGEYTYVNCYNRAGIILYSLKQYQDAGTYFMKSMEIDSNALGFNIILLAHSLERTNQINFLIRQLELIEVNSVKNDLVRKSVIYYRKKHLCNQLTKHQMSELEDYICFELKSICDKGGEIYRDVLKEDLMYYTSQTKNYKKIYLFERSESLK